MSSKFIMLCVSTEVIAGQTTKTLFPVAALQCDAGVVALLRGVIDYSYKDLFELGLRIATSSKLV